MPTHIGVIAAGHPQSDDEGAGTLLPPENLAGDEISDTFVSIVWDNPSGQPETPTYVQVRCTQQSMTWMELIYPSDSWFYAGLEPDTLYTFQVRYVVEEDGEITNTSPHVSVNISTTFTDFPDWPVEDPDGDVDIDIPDLDDPINCTQVWKLQEWTGPDSDDYVDVSPPVGGSGDGTAELETDDLDPVTTYRVCVKETCFGIEGDWFCGEPWLPPQECPDPYLSYPFNDSSLLAYIPKMCFPSLVVEAVSGVIGAHGPSWNGAYGQNPAYLIGGVTPSTVGSGGVVATGLAPVASGVAGTRSIGMTVKPLVEVTHRLRIGSMAIGARPVIEGGDVVEIRPYVAMLTGNAGVQSVQLLVEGPTPLSTIGTSYVLYGFYDEDSSELLLIVNGVEVASAPVVDTPQAQATATWEIMLGEGSTVTNCALWDAIPVYALTGTVWYSTLTETAEVTWPTLDEVLDGDLANETNMGLIWLEAWYNESGYEPTYDELMVAIDPLWFSTVGDMSAPDGPAIGGTVTINGGYRYHTFIVSGLFSAASTAGRSGDYIIVGGGGAGGHSRGGGGGGGAVIVQTGVSLPEYSNATIGAGANGNNSNLRGSSGSNSSFAGTTAHGGGGGGGSDNATGLSSTTGSGGGGRATTGSGGSGGAYGNSGGNSDSSSVSRSGGGGGAGAGGSNGGLTNGGNGGQGLQWPAGSGVYYGSGGGGNQNGNGGSGAGNAGGSTSPGGNATANRGGGGGGGGSAGTDASGDGGSGVVIVRYPV